MLTTNEGKHLTMLYACILAGGSGTRLWPVSRKAAPKQTKPFIDDKTLLQKTYERLRESFDTKHIWIATGKSDISVIKKQIPNFSKKNLSLEPERRDTAAALGLATLKIHHHDPDSYMININSDAYITSEKEYIRVIKVIEKFLKSNPTYIAGIGITPEYPETGFGYIQKGKFLTKIGKDTLYTVETFKEKPDKKTAEKYVKSGKFLWNPTLFAWKTSHMLDLFKKYVPKLHEGLMKIEKTLGTKNEEKVISEIYPLLPKISIDYAIFEKAQKMAVLPADFGWNDVGNWSTLHDLQEKDNHLNVVKGTVINIDSKNNLIYAKDKKLIAVAGVKNLIIIDTHDALLICNKENSHDVKKIVERIEKEEHLHDYL